MFNRRREVHASNRMRYLSESLGMTHVSPRPFRHIGGQYLSLAQLLRRSQTRRVQPDSSGRSSTGSPMNEASVTPRPKEAWTAAKVRRAVALAIGACALATTTARASVGNPEHLAPDQLSQIEAVCQTAMGLSGSLTTHYYACAESLSHSYAARLKANPLLAARQDCLARGLKPGTTALSECELTPHAQQVAQNLQPMLETALPTPRAKSYFSASFDEIRRREQRACAEIGYDPVGAGFDRCVADLAAELNDADHPVS